MKNYKYKVLSSYLKSPGDDFRKLEECLSEHYFDYEFVCILQSEAGGYITYLLRKEIK